MLLIKKKEKREAYVQVFSKKKREHMFKSRSLHKCSFRPEEHLSNLTLTTRQWSRWYKAFCKSLRDPNLNLLLTKINTAHGYRSFHIFSEKKGHPLLFFLI